ncbi:MAG: adenylate kinase family protein [Candidatus Bathyarchaeota archaeon]|nr:adenylate kinase family protein [Candidatus Bathyarchaeota archaeon]
MVVTGTPGTGKTTLSKLLSNELGTVHIELSKYAMEKGFIVEEDKERETLIINLEELGDALEKRLEADENIILDGHYAHDLVNPDTALQVFVLRRAPWELKQILESRGYNNMKVWENLEAEIIGICSSEALEAFPSELVCEIDTSNASTEEILRKMISILNGTAQCVSGEIDWMQYSETLEILRTRPCI